MECNRYRRSLLLGGAAGMLATRFPAAFAQSDGGSALKDAYIPRTKYALLIGNRYYSNNKDIPPAHKNVTDVREALEFLEFNVTSHTDLDANGMRAAIASYAAMIRGVAENTLSGSLAVVFYFCGHGFQSDGQNYLVPARIDPSGEGAVKASLKLMEEVLAMLPQRYPGLSVALIDACRTDPTFKKGADDFNQISAPEGTMVFFATRAGRPALAPIDPNRNTFFTEALYDILTKSNGVTPLDDLFQLAASACQRRVKAEFDKVKLSLAPQFPEVTTNLRGKFVIRNKDMEIRRTKAKTTVSATTAAAGSAEEDRWMIVRKAIKPREVVRLCEAFLKEFPAGEYTQTAQATLDGARLAADSQRIAGLSNDAIDLKAGDEGFRDDLVKALRGDKDAAHRVAVMYREGKGIEANIRRTEIWLKFSAELGNGIASWQLAEYYGAAEMVGEAARYERRAVELGYRPPPRLSNRGY